MTIAADLLYQLLVALPTKTASSLYTFPMAIITKDPNITYVIAIPH